MSETIERLAKEGGRLPGSDADRDATDYLAGELEQLGREVEIDEIAVRSDHHFAHAVCVAVAIVGCVISTKSAPAGVILLLAASAAMYLDLTARLYTVRYLLPSRKTRNLISPGHNPKARARVMLVAHHDAGRTGLLYARFGGRLPGPIGRFAGPLDAIFWTIALGLVLAAVRILIGDPGWLTALQFLTAIVLAVELLLLIDAGLSAASAGASSNASGVAAVLELADALDAERPERLDIHVLFTGGGSGLMLGMRDWLRRNDSQLRRQLNFFVNLDTVGAGEVRYVTAEGYAAVYEHDRELIGLCAQVAGDGSAEPTIRRRGSDAVLPAIKGHPSVTICCLDERGRAANADTTTDTADNVDAEATERAIDFAERLIRRMDAELSDNPPKPVQPKPKKSKKPEKEKPQAKAGRPARRRRRRDPKPF